MAKIINDASLLTRPQGLVLLNPIAGGRTRPVAPPQPILLEQSIKDLAEIRQSLQEEAEAFRHVVVSAGNGMREALAAREGIDVSVAILSPYLLKPRLTSGATTPASNPVFCCPRQRSSPSYFDTTICLFDGPPDYRRRSPEVAHCRGAQEAHRWSSKTCRQQS